MYGLPHALHLCSAWLRWVHRTGGGVSGHGPFCYLYGLGHQPPRTRETITNSSERKIVLKEVNLYIVYTFSLGFDIGFNHSWISICLHWYPITLRLSCLMQFDRCKSFGYRCPCHRNSVCAFIHNIIQFMLILLISIASGMNSIYKCIAIEQNTLRNCFNQIVYFVTDH